MSINSLYISLIVSYEEIMLKGRPYLLTSNLFIIFNARPNYVTEGNIYILIGHQQLTEYAKNTVNEK